MSSGGCSRRRRASPTSQLRYLHPSNTVWGMVTRYHHSYLAHADSLTGVRPTILLPLHGRRGPTPPCNLTLPRGVTCRDKAVDGEELASHLKACEDYWKGVKLFD